MLLTSPCLKGKCHCLQPCCCSVTSEIAWPWPGILQYSNSHFYLASCTFYIAFLSLILHFNIFHLSFIYRISHFFYFASGFYVAFTPEFFSFSYASRMSLTGFCTTVLFKFKNYRFMDIHWNLGQFPLLSHVFFGGGVQAHFPNSVWKSCLLKSDWLKNW